MNNPLNQNIAIVFNLKAGKGKSLHVFQSVKSKLEKLNIAYTELDLTKTNSIDSKFSDLLVIGGDGTMNYTLNHFKTIDIPITLIAAGSGNDFAKMLYGKSSLDEMISKLLGNNITKIDAGICNEKYFINGVGAGFDALVAKKLLHKKFLSGHFAYLAAVIQLLFSYKSLNVEIVSDELNYKGKMFMICIANSKTEGGGFMVAPDAKLDDGFFDAVLVKPISILTRLMHLPTIEKGKHLGLSFINYKKIKTISIESDSLIPVHLEGEYLESKKITIEMLAAKFLFKI